FPRHQSSQPHEHKPGQNGRRGPTPRVSTGTARSSGESSSVVEFRASSTTRRCPGRVLRPASLLNSREGLCGSNLPGHLASLRSCQEPFVRPERWQYLHSPLLAFWPNSVGHLASLV